MIGILASVVDGVLVGAVYGIAAMGLTLIWGVMNVINLSHGAIIVLGMFVVYFLTEATGLNAYFGIPLVLVLGFVAGLIIYWVSVNRVIGRPILMSLLATFALNMIIIGLGTAAWTTSPYNVPVSLPGITVRGYTFTGTHITAAIIAIITAGLLYLFLHYTRPGKAIRAVASNRDAAELNGIPTRQVLSLAFGLGVALACVSGALISTLFPFTVLSGASYQLKSFVVTVLGGLGNPAGALLGGIALGVVEGLATPFTPVSWTPIIEFGLFVLVLIAFPRGIFAFSRT
ncbi:MAG TPA: branched-chain amino acid ABC transporter permease [Pseudolabrys sp.]|jgi:branched-subunit amino acid ABC-type transport system permease component|nr:branched-chain amino acid ABC transporter permease [Pseudolabrys sp.]